MSRLHCVRHAFACETIFPATIGATVAFVSQSTMDTSNMSNSWHGPNPGLLRSIPLSRTAPLLLVVLAIARCGPEDAGDDAVLDSSTPLMSAEQISDVGRAICLADYRCTGKYNGRSKEADCVAARSSDIREAMEGASATGGAFDEVCFSRKLVAFDGSESCEWDDCFGIICSLFAGAGGLGAECIDDWSCTSGLTCGGQAECIDRCD